MKNIFRLLFVIAGIALMSVSCDKVGKLPFYANGAAPVLTSSATSITPAPADSNKVVVSFAWSNPKYSTDSTKQKFVLEIDSTGRNFTKEITKIVTGTLGISFTGQQLNTILAAFGFTPAKSASFDVRLTSSYGNNNEQLKSNVITVNMTSYLVPITLVPSSTNALTLLVANATNTAISFSWNASPYGADTINYAVQMDTVGGKFANPQTIKYGYGLTSALLVNDLNAYAISAGVPGGSTKSIEFRLVSYLGTSYTIPLVFSNIVTFGLTTFTPIPPNLYIVGDATTGAWSNPVPTPSQQFTRIDAVSYGMIIKLTAGGGFVFLPLNGDWGHKYGGTSASGGALLADNAVPGSNTPAPAVTGMYKIVVNFQTASYTITPYTGAAVPTNLYIVGDATAGAWNNPVPTPSQQFTQIDNASFQITLPFTGTGSYVFLPLNGDWGHKFGGTSAAGGTLLADGAVPGSNTPVPTVAGTYKITANFIANTYSVIKQ